MRKFIFTFLCLMLSLKVLAQAEPVEVLEKGVASPKELKRAMSCFGTNFILVRHAEKMTDGKDPQLTEIGIRRAEHLAALLKNIRISEIYSTDYNRTKETAQPLASFKHLEVKIYPAKESAETVKKLKYSGRSILITGHSNTLHVMLNELTTSNLFTEISEADYTNIYVVNITRKKVKVHHFNY